MREFLIKLLKFSILIILGFSLGIYFERSSSQTSFSPPIDDPTKVEKEKIDSLQLIVDELTIEREHLKDSIQVKYIIREKEVDRIHDLPVDSAVLYLQTKLRDFENY